MLYVPLLHYISGSENNRPTAREKWQKDILKEEWGRKSEDETQFSEKYKVS